MNPTNRFDPDAWREGILAKLDGQRTALAVIDLQNDFCSTEGALAALGSDVTPAAAVAHRVSQFLPEARPNLGLLAFFRLVYDTDYLSSSQRERLLRGERPVICARDGRGSELFIETQPSDFVFEKHRYSAFSNSAFHELLKVRGIDTVAVAGVDTHICVEGTVRNGYDLGFRMVVLSDLVGTRQSEVSRHEASLALCERYFGIVAPSHQFLSAIVANSLKAPSRSGAPA
jgi:ureidoacrylate peracid hydrolase